ncbi:MAG TPA: TetR/AcrR family transcriptional regulator [Candidatus Acidoferrum sp.]|nr:TetR/AcrR family transcriptional regulator [Candidatus Acidoferrum sp.]
MRATTKSRPRTKPPEERRDELMNAAQRLFLKQGVASTTIEQITSGADVAKGTFYLYFSSKDDVLAALGDRFGQEHLANIKDAISAKPIEDWQGKLATWGRACVTYYLDSIRLHDIAFYGSRPRTREGLVDNIVIDHLCDLLQAGSDARAWAVDDPRFTAVFLFSGLHAVVDDAYSKEKRINRSRLAQRAEGLIFRTVGLPPR